MKATSASRPKNPIPVMMKSTSKSRPKLPIPLMMESVNESRKTRRRKTTGKKSKKNSRR